MNAEWTHIVVSQYLVWLLGETFWVKGHIAAGEESGMMDPVPDLSPICS
jgi:hypothetical protein